MYICQPFWISASVLCHWISVLTGEIMVHLNRIHLPDINEWSYNDICNLSYGIIRLFKDIF